MIANYLLIAWRQLSRYKLYAAINILGLALGLTIYLLGTVIVAYERSHDDFWANDDRIFTAGTIFGPSANIGIAETDGIYTAFTPFIREEVQDVEAVARTVGAEYLVSIGDDHYYQRIRFADPELLDIFDFTYQEGGPDALDDPQGVLHGRVDQEQAVRFRQPRSARRCNWITTSSCTSPR